MKFCMPLIHKPLCLKMQMVGIYLENFQSRILKYEKFGEVLKCCGFNVLIS